MVNSPKFGLDKTDGIKLDFPGIFARKYEKIRSSVAIASKVALLALAMGTSTLGPQELYAKERIPTSGEVVNNMRKSIKDDFLLQLTNLTSGAGRIPFSEKQKKYFESSLDRILDDPGKQERRKGLESILIMLLKQKGVTQKNIDDFFSGFDGKIDEYNDEYNIVLQGNYNANLLAYNDSEAHLAKLERSIEYLEAKNKKLRAEQDGLLRELGITKEQLPEFLKKQKDPRLTKMAEELKNLQDQLTNRKKNEKMK